MHRLKSHLFLFFACITGLCLLSMKNVAMMNQGDIYRVFDSLLGAQPVDVQPLPRLYRPGFHIWSYTNPVVKPWQQRNMAWIYVWAHVRLQQIFSRHFDLYLLALISKLIVLGCCYRMSKTLPKHLGISPGWRPLVFVLLVSAFFLAHNIAFLNSFYQEHVLFGFSSGVSGRAFRRASQSPYWRHPTLLFRLWHWSARAHFTVKSFHLFPYNVYILPSDRKSFHNGRALVAASALRERLITHNYLVFLAAGLLLPFLCPRSVGSVEIRAAMLLLALAIPSQFVISLLGDGVRDLSKHLAAAQLSLDLLCVFLVLQAAAWISAKWISVRKKASEQIETAALP